MEIGIDKQLIIHLISNMCRKLQEKVAEKCDDQVLYYLPFPTYTRPSETTCSCCLIG